MTEHQPPRCPPWHFLSGPYHGDPERTECPHRGTHANQRADYNVGHVHVGGYVWKNEAEMEWECADDCPHPSHERPEEPAHIGSHKQVSP